MVIEKLQKTPEILQDWLWGANEPATIAHLKTGAGEGQRIFTGQEYDGSSGLYYYNARYMNPNTARFISEDPAFLAIGDSGQIKNITQQALQQYLSDPQHLNSYSYARNNPIINTDPTGQASTNAWLSDPLGTALQVGGLKAVSGIYSWFNPTKSVSNDLFNRSLSLNPSNLSISDSGLYSNVVSDIRGSKDYQGFVANAIGQANSQNSLEFNYSYFGSDAADKQKGSAGNSINFSGGDLGTSIGGTLRTDISGKRMDNGLWSLSVAIQDQYNFDFHGYGYYKNSPGVTTANNAMLIPQATGTISNYNIDIKFKDVK